MIRIVLIVSLLAFISCKPQSSSSTPHLVSTSIVNGVELKTGDPLTSSVVGLVNTKDNSICTGSLIAPNIVMTAAHCAPKRPSDLKVVFGLDVDDIMNSRELDILQQYALTVTDFKVSAIWNPKNETIEVDTGDIALLKFKGSLPAGYGPAKFLADKNLLKKGSMVTVAGFGVNFVESVLIEPKKYRHLEQAIERGDVFCDANRINCFEVEMSGEAVLRKTEAPISLISETEIRLNESKSGTCNGDSGGPAFLELNGQFFLFGVTSRGSMLCDETGVYTNALAYRKWMDDTIKILK